LFVDRRVLNGDSMRPGNGGDFAHQVDQQVARRRNGEQITRRLLRDGRNGIEAGVPEQLAPALQLDVIDDPHRLP